MKILLLNPPTIDNKAIIREGRCNQEQGVWGTLWPPITLVTVGAMLEDLGHDVEILDCAALGMRRSEFLDRLSKRDDTFIIWSTATPSIKSDLAFANEIKEIQPDIKTAVFGTHVTALAEQCLTEAESLDYIIRNEPEETLVVLAESLDKGLSVKDIQGLSYKEGKSRVIHNPPRPFIRDLDSLPFPAWHLLELEQYKLPLINEKFLILSPIRGCPYPCTFCTARTYYGNRMRRRSVQKVMEEVEYNSARFNTHQFFIWADTFTADRDYVTHFCQAIKDRGLKIGWACNSRVDTIDHDLLRLMAEAGCWMISYGFESGNQTVLNATRKNISLSQSRDAVKLANRMGIRVVGHFVLGFPKETEESLKETIDFSLSLDIELAQFYCAVPFPGSYLYDLAKTHKWIEDKTFDEFSQDRAVMKLPGLVPAIVNEYRKKAYRKFYLRPNCVLRVLRLLHVGGLWGTLKNGFRFIKWATV